MNEDKGYREAVYESHELAIKMRAVLHAHPKGSSVSVPYEELERFVVLASFIAGWKLSEIGATKIDELRRALAVMLDQVDYTHGACAVTEMVGAVLPREVIESARKALEGSKP